ncbi:MAG: hypothetical protein M1835_002381 [Candelina submexicana]|nr:MAG: hypothetical protein M1835_002381 [Candelina submexicana]
MVSIDDIVAASNKGRDGVEDTPPWQYINDFVANNYERTDIKPKALLDKAYDNGSFQYIATWGPERIIAAVFGPLQCLIADCVAMCFSGTDMFGVGRNMRGHNIIFMQIRPGAVATAEFKEACDRDPFDISKDLENLVGLGFKEPHEETPWITKDFRYRGGEHGPSRDDPKNGYKRLGERSETGGPSAGATGARGADDRYRSERQGDHSSSRHAGSRHPQGRRAGGRP